MLTCKETSYLASKKLDSKLTLREHIGFSLHITVCRLCRLYSYDLKKLQKMIQKTAEKKQALVPESTKLSKHAREKIDQSLDKTIHSSRYN